MSSDEKKIVITSAVRTAVGTFNGSLKNMQGHELGSIVVKEAIKKSKLKLKVKKMTKSKPKAKLIKSKLLFFLVKEFISFSLIFLETFYQA